MFLAKKPVVNVVIDTNVIVSAALSPYGNPAKIFEMLLNEEIHNFTSDEIMEELRDVLHRSKIVERLKIYERDFILDRFELFSSKVIKSETIDIIKDDPDDNKILECAISAGVGYIISGDDHLLSLSEYKSIKILSPQELIQLIEKMRSKDG